MSEHRICRSRPPRRGEQDPDCPVRGDQTVQGRPGPPGARLAFHGTTAQAWH
ncbi:MAG: hypothetical protein QOJ50_2388, partial [Cryptosporangiaceae bacterium]|nr:hypothetical protein [Cryptosporangiaceae bacterium]